MFLVKSKIQLIGWRAFAIHHIKLPDLGEGTKEATVKSILIKEGEKVTEVSSDNQLVSRFSWSVHR